MEIYINSKSLSLPKLSGFPNEGYVHLAALVSMDSSTKAV